MSKEKPRETSVVKSIRKKLNTLPRCKTLKFHGSMYTEAGTPDIIGCCCGRFFAFEVKRSEDEEPTKIQALRLSQFAKAGAITSAIYKSAQAIEILERECYDGPARAGLKQATCPGCGKRGQAIVDSAGRPTTLLYCKHAEGESWMWRVTAMVATTTI